jgi:PKD repeat protein
MMFLILSISVPSLAAIKTVESKGTINTQRNLQANYKLAYETRRKQSMLRPQSRSVVGQNRSKAISKCQDFSCRFNKVHSRISRAAKTITSGVSTKTSQLKNHWANSLSKLAKDLSYWVQKNVLRNSAFRTNELPTAGSGFNFDILTSGSRPLVVLRTNDTMTDVDGTIASVVWDFGDGTSMTIPARELNDRGQVYHIFADPAHYNVTVTIYDDLGGSTAYYGYVETSNNQLPVPSFTVDTNSGASPLTVTFTPTASDPEGGLQNIHWNFGDGNGADDDTFEPVEHEYTSSGTYEVEVTVRDTNNSIAVSKAQVFVDDTPPTGGSFPSIVLSSTEIIGKVPLFVEFDASQSFDIDGVIASYNWDFGDYEYPNNGADTAIANHTYYRPGTYYGKLTVKDEDGRSSDFYFQVFVEANELLEPEIMAYQQNDSDALDMTFSGNVVNLRSTVMDDQYFWDFGDTHTGNHSEAYHTYGSGDTYTVTLTALDVHGVRHEITKDITISTTIDKPSIQFNVDNDAVGVFDNITFDGSGSSDPGINDPLVFRWDFGDGEHFEGVDSEDHDFAERGVYLTQLTITNTRGISNYDQHSIYVIDGSDPHPTILYSPKVGAAPLTVNFDAGNSSDDGATITKYSWGLNDGETKSFSGSTLEYTFNDPGEYFVQLFIEDSVGNIRKQGETVIVYDSGSIPSNSAPVAAFSATVDPGDAYSYSFDAFASTDADNDHMIYEWKVNGQEIQPGLDSFYRFPYSNIYNVELTVYDQWGASDTTSQQIDISTAAVQQIVFDYAPIKPVASQTIHFGAENSIIPGSTIVSYAWDFGDSSTGSGSTATHSYASAGTYTVELTLTDSESNTFVTTQDVVVESAASNPTLKLSIRDNESLTEVTNSGTYTGTSFPETVRLSLLGTSDSNSFIKDATWDLGNGETAFGSDIEYTYTKPGTYNISVTGYDVSNAYSTATATIVIPNNCKRLEGETTCLSWNGLTSDVLPFSQSTWVLEKTGNFATASKYFPKGWIYLKALDGSDETVDISSYATVAANQITISKSQLIQKNINFRRAYKLMIETLDSSDDPVLAEIPMLHFGAGRLNITAAQTGVKLVITNPSAQFKKFIDLDASTFVSLQDLPLGPTSIVAQKGDDSVSTTIDLEFNKVETVSIDTDPAKSLRKISSVLPKMDAIDFLKDRGDWAMRGVKTTPRKNPRTRVDWPAWAMDICGQDPPFNPTNGRVISENQSTMWGFSSSNPMAQSTFRDLPYSMRKPVQLSCGISSESLNYGLIRWKYKDGPARCWNDSKPLWYWNWYLQNVNMDDEVVTVKYEVEDNWSGEKYTNFLVFSASDIMRRQGRELAEITQRKGVLIDGDGDWSYRQNFQLQIPPHFKRPKIRFELDAQLSAVAGNFYDVGCDVAGADSEPKAIDLRPTAFNPSSDRKARNAQFSLQDRFNYFPVHFNDGASSAVDIDADSAKAEYEVSIQYYNQSLLTWTGVDVEFEYNGATHTESYAFAGGGTNDAVNGIYKNTFVIDTSVLAGVFTWEPGVDRIHLKVTPKGEDDNSDPITGKAFKKNFVALFDAQIIQANQSTEICSRGFYGDSLSTFGQDILMRGLKTMSDEGIGVRCSNMSLPFGGLFDLAGLSQNTYQHGLIAKARTFNDTDDHQDDYDASNSAERKADIDAYKAFSASALAIAEIEDELDLMSNPTDKKKIYDFCHPSMGAAKFPCHDNTVFADLGHDEILQICQWYSTSGAEIDGCPAGYLTNVIRFSKWVKQNVADLTNTKNLVLIQTTMATGPHFDDTAYENYQKDALVLGVWPDGKPIWDVSTGGEELTNARVATCHEKTKGCEWIKDSFVNDAYYLSGLEFLAGWRL